MNIHPISFEASAVAKSRRAQEPKTRRHPDDEDEAPRKKKKQADEDEEGGDDGGPIKPRKKRKSAAGPVQLVLRICAGVVGGIGLIVLLYWVYSPVGTDHALLCYFPPETVSLSGYDANEGMRNHKLKYVHETLISNYKVFGEKRFNESSIDLQYTDVDKYMSGTAAGNYEEEKDLPPQERRGSLTVIRFTKEIDTDKFINSFSGRFRSTETKSRDGKPYYQLQEFVDRTVGGKTQQELRDDISYFFPNKRTLVYATTRRELEEALKRQPGKVELTGNMRELANKVDGLYFQCSTGFSVLTGGMNSMAFALSFVDADVRDQRAYVGVAGTGSWFASNGNDFLYASGTLYVDVSTARTVRSKLEASFLKAQADIYGGESGRPSGLEDPFNPKDQAKNSFGGGGGGGGSQANDILDALGQYTKHARVRRLGRLVVVEGTISHGMPEQGVFEKFWAVVGSKYKYDSQQGGMGMPGMGMPGPGGAGMPGPGMPGPGMPGPGQPGPPRP